MLGWLYIRALVEYLSHFNFRAFFWLNMISLNLSNCIQLKLKTGFPGSLDNKESACSAGDLGWIPGSGKLPREGKGYPLQYFCLENYMERGAWWTTVHGVAKSRTGLSDQQAAGGWTSSCKTLITNTRKLEHYIQRVSDSGAGGQWNQVTPLI